MEKSGTDVESGVWLMVLENYHKVDYLGIKKSDVFARMWQGVRSGRGCYEKLGRGKEMSKSIVLLIGGEAAIYICKESIPQPVIAICS